MRLLVDRLSLGILAVVSAYDATVRAFAAAARAGDLAALVSVLDPDVVPRQDGGGIVNVARQQVQGADRVARFLLRALEGNPTMEVFDQETPDGLGFAMWIEGRVSGVVTMDVAGDKVTDVRMVVNPEKLALWN